MEALFVSFLIFLSLSSAENTSLLHRIQTLENEIKDLKGIALTQQAQCDCNLTIFEDGIRENGIKIAENKFQLSVHRERLNEHEAQIEANQNMIETNKATIESTKVEFEQLIVSTRTEIETEIMENSGLITTNSDGIELNAANIESVSNIITGSVNVNINNNLAMIQVSYLSFS